MVSLEKETLDSQNDFKLFYSKLTQIAKEYLENDIKISGPFPADTIFLKKNYKQYDVIVGMYHDQVLTPLKTLYEFNAINITIGLPFLRISPDHLSLIHI